MEVVVHGVIMEVVVLATVVEVAVHAEVVELDSSVTRSSAKLVEVVAHIRFRRGT